MKKLFRRLLPLTLALAMLLSMSANAAFTLADTDSKQNTLSINGGVAGTVTAKFNDENEEIMEVTYSGGLLKVGSPYLVLMYTDDAPVEDTIKYINQDTAKDVDGVATITFNVYPSEFKTSNILIAGVDVATGQPTSIVAAIFEAKYLLGDVKTDNVVDLYDAVAIVQYFIGAITLEAHQIAVADVDGVKGIDLFDAVRIVQYFIGLYDHLG